MRHAIAPDPIETKEPLAWRLEDGTHVSCAALCDEIIHVPLTKYWRLTHMVFLWPQEADPDSDEVINGFDDGFAIELVASDRTIAWVLESLARKEQHNARGTALDGPAAIREAFQAMEDIHEKRLAQRS